MASLKSTMDSVPVSHKWPKIINSQGCDKKEKSYIFELDGEQGELI